MYDSTPERVRLRVKPSTLAFLRDLDPSLLGPVWEDFGGNAFKAPLENAPVEQYRLNPYVKVILNRRGHLTWLEISGYVIPALPANLTSLTHLEDLDLRELGLDTLPAGIGRLARLDSLDLTGNRLEDLPRGVARLRRLTDLRVGNNQLRALPPGLGGLRRLAHLDVSGNQLEGLAMGPPAFRALKFLDASNNRLAAVPAVLRAAPRLEVVDLHSNALGEFVAGSRDFRHLHALDLSLNPLDQLAWERGALRNLGGLGVHSTGLTSLPPCLQFVPLKSVGFSKNPAGEVPPVLRGCKRLRGLGLANCEISVLPGWFRDYPELEELLLGENPLAELPATFEGFPRLKVLDLAGADFTTLPARVFQFPALERVNLDHNRVSRFPERLVVGPAFKELRLWYNDLLVLPPCLRALVQREVLVRVADATLRCLHGLPRWWIEMNLYSLGTHDWALPRSARALARAKDLNGLVAFYAESPEDLARRAATGKPLEEWERERVAWEAGAWRRREDARPNRKG